jgi:2-polyprenyl-3-methyl-5-hydroxy-6-metoxy-1,4-benzoquinol methylase
MVDESFDVVYLKEYYAQHGLNPGHPLYRWWIKVTDEYYCKEFEALKRSVPFFLRGVMPSGAKLSLDYGCGTGWLTVGLSGDSYALGIDKEIDLVKMASERARIQQVDADFVLADGCYLPFSEDIFDFIVCYQVLEHVKDVEGAIAEVVRVCRSTGRIFVAVPSKTRITLGLSPPHKKPYERLFTYAGLKELFERQGSTFHIIYPESRGWKRLISRLLRRVGVLKHVCGLRGYAEGVVK